MPEAVQRFPDSPAQGIAVMVTRRCNMACSHCSVESGPGVRGEPAEAELLQWVREAAAAGVRSVLFTGGEPMLRASTVLQLLRECRRRGLATAMTSNGFWGRTSGRARRQLRVLHHAGLGRLTLSYDAYHADFQGPEPILNIARAAAEFSVPLNINVVRSTDEPELTQIIARLEGARATPLRLYDLQPVGRARELPAASHRGEMEGFCSACASPAITDDGRVVACNGPAYFERPESPLVLGSLRDTSVAELLDRHRRDPILDTIRTRGPAGLRDELSRIPGFERFPFRSRYRGICELCHQVTRSEAAVAALRERFGRSAAAAERVAAWQVITGSRQSGELTPGYANGIGACRVFFRAAWKPDERLGEDTQRILGRADLDWRRLAEYLCACGLARPLLPVLQHPDIERWAPDFFCDTLSKRAIADGMRELIQREVIQRIADALREFGTRGVLLKGTALFLQAPPDVIPRATGDVDIFVDPAVAVSLRAHLLANGFAGPVHPGSSRSHDVAPVVYQGISVEIHRRIAPSFCDLPESAMLAQIRPVPDSNVLFTLGAEGLMLHAAVHTSVHSLSCGLKTARDLLTAVRIEPDVDWERLAIWATKSRMPRGFWVPFRILVEEMSLPVPAVFFRYAPADEGARRIEVIARHRLFAGVNDIDTAAQAGLMLLIHDSWRGRASYLRWLAAGVHGGVKIRRAEGRPRTAGESMSRALSLSRDAWRRYQQYRRIMSGAPGRLRYRTDAVKVDAPV